MFTGKVQPGKNVVVLGGSGAAISLALYVIDKLENVKDSKISMIDLGPRFGLDVNPSYIWRYRLRLKKANVQQLTFGKVKEITDVNVIADWTMVDRKTKEKQHFRDQVIPADTVILARLIPNKEFNHN